MIGNPAARRASVQKLERAAAFLREKGFHVEVLMTQKRGDAEIQAKESAGKKPFLIIAAGGDGTINEVINGMVWSGVPLSILPLGTTNVLAKELGIPEEVQPAMERALKGRPKTVSLGRITLGGDNASADRYFCLMAGIGFDGKAVRDTNPSLKKISGEAAYILSGMKNLLWYSPSELKIKANGDEYTGYAAVIGKAAKYGGHFKITPDACLPDPYLYACIFQGRKRTDLLRYVLGVIRGTHLTERDIVYIRTTDMEVRGEAHIQIDGDYLGVTPARLSVAKDALKIVY